MRGTISAICSWVVSGKHGCATFLCGQRRHLLYPAHGTVAMGCAPAVGIVRTVMDVCAKEPGLPGSRRVTFDAIPPHDFPCWGSIVDDIWAVDNGDGYALDWCNQSSKVWEPMHVPVNHKKDVDQAEGADIQGACLHPTSHTVGVRWRKKFALAQGTLYLLQKDVGNIKMVHSGLGKFHHDLSVKACLSGLFVYIYKWIDFTVTKRKIGGMLWSDAWFELLYAVVLLLFAGVFFPMAVLQPS